jgi:hypothetical protein
MNLWGRLSVLVSIVQLSPSWGLVDTSLLNEAVGEAL